MLLQKLGEHQKQRRNSNNLTSSQIKRKNLKPVDPEARVTVSGSMIFRALNDNCPRIPCDLLPATVSPEHQQSSTPKPFIELLNPLPQHAVITVPIAVAMAPPNSSIAHNMCSKGAVSSALRRVIEKTWPDPGNEPRALSQRAL